jgi:anaphase-promoting complex subunit 2
MEAQGSTMDDRRRQMFQSVFASASLIHDSPTPKATPNIGVVKSGQPWGIQASPKLEQNNLTEYKLAEVEIQKSRAWHFGTTFLKLSSQQIRVEDIKANGPDAFLSHWTKEPNPETVKAIDSLVQADFATPNSQRSLGVIQLIAWYTAQVRQHFLTFVRPNISLDVGEDENEAEDALSDLLFVVQATQQIYSAPVVKHILPLIMRQNVNDHSEKNQAEIREKVMAMQWRFRRDLHSVISISFPDDRLSDLLGVVLLNLARTTLALHDTTLTEQMSYNAREAEAAGGANDKAIRQLNAPNIEAGASKIALQKLGSIMRHLRDIGLGGERGERIFAGVMDKFFSMHVKTSYAYKWRLSARCTSQIRSWITESYAHLAVVALSCFDDDELLSVAPSDKDKSLRVSRDDLDRWYDEGIARLGKLRISELSDIVMAWPQSLGAIEDLKAYVKSPQTRALLVGQFSKSIQKRFLQPGTSTADILYFYIHLISALGALDPKGNLLDRVARQIRKYLRDRDDTIKIIVTGLLASSRSAEEEEDKDSGHPVYSHLAKMVTPSKTGPAPADEDGDLDLDDMDWVPDPIDVSPDYKKSKGNDEFSSLVSLFESREVFIREFQGSLQDRLLRQKEASGTESRILEMLKARPGDTTLQACEVMLYDMQQSEKVDQAVHSSDALQAQEKSNTLKFHTKVLSRLYWPSLDDEEFTVPAPIAEIQSRYESNFEQLKKNRKLTWLPSLGTVTVELELEDRQVVEKATPAQATVICAFSDSDEGIDGVVSLAVSHLETTLEMDESLLRSCLSFWVSKAVLITKDNEIYTVLENLSSRPQAGQADITNIAASQATASSAKVKNNAQMSVEWAFTQGLLRNLGPQPISNILMLLKMSVPGGHLAALNNAQAEETMKGFLEDKQAAGEVMFEKGVWKLQK